jgi:hypothetical protein
MIISLHRIYFDILNIRYLDAKEILPTRAHNYKHNLFKKQPRLPSDYMHEKSNIYMYITIASGLLQLAVVVCMYPFGLLEFIKEILHIKLK